NIGYVHKHILRIGRGIPRTSAQPIDTNIITVGRPSRFELDQVAPTLSLFWWLHGLGRYEPFAAGESQKSRILEGDENVAHVVGAKVEAKHAVPIPHTVIVADNCSASPIAY